MQLLHLARAHLAFWLRLLPGVPETVLETKLESLVDPRP